jgi:serine/threonine protein kinase
MASQMEKTRAVVKHTPNTAPPRPTHSIHGIYYDAKSMNTTLAAAGRPALARELASGAHGAVWSLDGGKFAVKISSDIKEAAKIAEISRRADVAKREHDLDPFMASCCVIPTKIGIKFRLTLLTMPLMGEVARNNFFENELTHAEFAYIVARPLTAGLAWLHLLGILHLDIKPANCLFDTTLCLAKLCDFGNSEITREDETIGRHKKRLGISHGIGTRGFYAGHHDDENTIPLGPKSDICALDTTLLKIRPNYHYDYQLVSDERIAYCRYQKLNSDPPTRSRAELLSLYTQCPGTYLKTLSGYVVGAREESHGPEVHTDPYYIKTLSGYARSATREESSDTTRAFDVSQGPEMDYSQ